MPKSKKFWEFRAAAGMENTGELMLYGDISNDSWWGDEVTPQQFKEDLDALGNIDTLNVFINSGGGDVFAGQAIHSMLKRHPAKVNVYVDGLAASIASVIAVAGDTVYMPANAMLMIHNPYTISIGNANEFRKLADDLDKISESLIAAYQGKTGLETDGIKQMMDNETWMTAEEAVNLGFADEIEQSKKNAAHWDGTMLSINGQRFDISKFKNIPIPQNKRQEPIIYNEGKTLSEANRQRIQQARNLLNEILDQMSEDQSDSGPNNTIPLEKQTENGLLSLFQAQVEINQNRRFNT